MDELLRSYPSQFMLPVMLTNYPTFEAAKIISDVKGRILPTSLSKIQRAEQMVDDFVDMNTILGALMQERELKMNPKLFQYELFQRAKKANMHIVLPEGEEPRIFQVPNMLSPSF